MGAIPARSGADMSKIQIGDAGVAGVRLIFQKPLAVLAWGLVFVVLYGLPLVAMISSIFPNLASLAALGAKGSRAATPDPAMFGMIAEIQFANLLMLLGSFIARAIVCSAICRAVLEPSASRFGYLRLGMQEVWVGLVSIVVGILIFAAMFAAMLVLAIPAGIVAISMGKSASPGVWVLLIGLGVLALVGFVLWISVRLSLAVPMSFADNQFRLFESWSATRGRTGSLIGVGLVAVLLLVVSQMVFGLLIALGFGGAVFTAAAGGHFNPATMGANPAAVLSAVGPWLIAGLLVLCLWMGAATSILMAPFAKVYEALRPSKADDQALVFS